MDIVSHPELENVQKVNNTEALSPVQVIKPEKFDDVKCECPCPLHSSVPYSADDQAIFLDTPNSEDTPDVDLKNDIKLENMSGILEDVLDDRKVFTGSVCVDSVLSNSNETISRMDVHPVSSNSLMHTCTHYSENCITNEILDKHPKSNHSDLTLLQLKTSKKDFVLHPGLQQQGIKTEGETTDPETKPEKVDDVKHECLCEIHSDDVHSVDEQSFFPDSSHSEYSLYSDLKDDIKLENFGSSISEVVFNDIETMSAELVSGDSMENIAQSSTSSITSNSHIHPCIPYHSSNKTKEILDINHINSKQSDLRPYKCTECDAKFETNRILNNHLQFRHSNNRPYHCTICDAKLKTKSTLNDHLQFTHSDVRTHDCNLCDVKFKRKSNLTAHKRRIHSTLRPYHCNHCDSKFKSRSNLKTHLHNCHSGLRPYHCEQCGAKFKAKNHLNVHLQTLHSDDRPYECNQCNAKFKRKIYLTNHVKFKHSDVHPYDCNHCSARFKRKTEYNRHFQRMHPVIVS